MMEAPLKTLNLIDKLTGESWSSIASFSSSMDPLEHHRLLCIAASTFTLHQSWWQPPPSTTKKRKGKELAEEESAAPNNHPKRRKIVLTDHQQNIIELKKRSDLVTKNNDNESFLGLTLGVSPVRPTTLPAHDEQLKEIRDNRVAKHDNDSLLKLNVGTNEVHHYHQRPVVRRSDPAKFNIKKKLTPSDLGHLSRLLLPKDMVTNYILPKFDEDLKARMRSEVGLEVTVFDEVRQKEYELIFKYLKSSGSYVFNGKWTHDFVKVLDLNKDDEIGLYLHSSTTPSPKPKFHFSLLKLAGQADEGSPAISSTRKE
ncbi:hypothetical protein ACLB2K_021204 [Fragaria x ananassa]